jgi:Divergent InlB B-repeat domain
MIRKLLVFLAAALALALAAALTASGSRATRADDPVVLRVEATAIDGALNFSNSNGWSWRCNVPALCTVRPQRGEVITITAEDGAASTFQRWDGACGPSANATCTLRVNENEVLVQARFSPLRLSLPAFGGGTIAVEPARPGSASVGRGCGYECADYLAGSVLRLRARANPGFHLSGWGGACSNIPPDYNCILTLNRNTIVSAAFEPNRPQTNTPGVSQDPVGAASEFSVQVLGNGSVVVPQMGSLPGAVCSPSCRFSRDLERWVDLKAIPRPGARFLGWSGPCRGAGICHFYNRGYGRTPSAITARFG